MGTITSKLSISLDNHRERSITDTALKKIPPSGQMAASRGCGQILIGADRDDTGRIDAVVCDVVVPLDVVKIHRFGNAVGLIKIFEIPEEIRIIDDSSDVAPKCPW